MGPGYLHLVNALQYFCILYTIGRGTNLSNTPYMEGLGAGRGGKYTRLQISTVKVFEPCMCLVLVVVQ